MICRNPQGKVPDEYSLPEYSDMDEALVSRWMVYGNTADEKEKFWKPVEKTERRVLHPDAASEQGGKSGTCPVPKQQFLAALERFRERKRIADKLGLKLVGKTRVVGKRKFSKLDFEQAT